MITNEAQYRSTKAHLATFETAISNLEQEGTPAGEDQLRTVQMDALRSQAEDLRLELSEYETLRSGSVRSFAAESLQELAGLLVKARIARGWTQRDLAERLGVAEQQIQRYESTGYASASLARLCDVATALGTDVREIVTLRTTDAA
jgi:HTH-type transcriptional regulator/antitoxin HigA